MCVFLGGFVNHCRQPCLSHAVLTKANPFVLWWEFKILPRWVFEYRRRLVFRDRRRCMVELSKLVCSYQFPLRGGTREARETQLIFHWRKAHICFLLDTKVFNSKEHSWQPGLCSLFTVVLSFCMPDLNVSSTGLTPPPQWVTSINISRADLPEKRWEAQKAIFDRVFRFGSLYTPEFHLFLAS